MSFETTLALDWAYDRSLPGRITTPALVYDLGKLAALANVARSVRESSSAKVLYAVKACSFEDVLQALSPSLDGFAVSSLFEARLVSELHPKSSVHLTTPGLRDDEVDTLAKLCSFVTFNSETQLYRHGPRLHANASIGLRVNTQISNVQDSRYDPARGDSKLGVPLNLVPEIVLSAPVVNGLHFHTNADSEDLTELEANVEALARAMEGIGRVDWVNFGGGYLFENICDFDPLLRAVKIAKQNLADEVFVEPGASLVRMAGHLIASVVDIFERNGTRIAILDASVNHLPEVLEFGYQPPIENSTADGAHQYLLGGGSCLAGDLFGRYCFDAPLTIGAPIIFGEAGAYAQAKSHRFNGINLPSVWVTTPDGHSIKRQTPSYENYRQHWMASV